MVARHSGQESVGHQGCGSHLKSLSHLLPRETNPERNTNQLMSLGDDRKCGWGMASSRGPSNCRRRRLTPQEKYQICSTPR
jgi:hypothetical protein